MQTFHKSILPKLSKLKHNILFLALLIFIVSFFLRFHSFTIFPYGLHVDEAENALLSVTANWFHPPAFFEGARSGGRNIILIYLIKLSRTVFGDSIFALRVVPAFIGSLTVSLFFTFCLNITKSIKKSLLLTLLFLTSTTHIIFSRLILRAILVPFFILICANFFSLFINSKNKVYLYLFSIFLGLGLYSYYSFLIVIPIGCFLLLILYLNKTITFKHLVLAVLTTFIITTPMLNFWRDDNNRYEYFRRGQEVSIFNPIWSHNSEKWIANKMVTNSGAIINKLTINSYEGDNNNYRYQIPFIGMLDPFVLALLIFLTYKYIKPNFNKIKQNKFITILIPLFILAMSAIPTIITYDIRSFTIRLLPTFTFILILLVVLFKIVKLSKKEFKFASLLILVSFFLNIYTSQFLLFNQWKNSERFDQDFFNLGLLIKEKLNREPTTTILIPDNDDRFKNIIYLNLNNKNVIRTNQDKAINNKLYNGQKVLIVKSIDFVNKLGNLKPYNNKIEQTIIIPKDKQFEFTWIEFE